MWRGVVGAWRVLEADEEEFECWKTAGSGILKQNRGAGSCKQQGLGGAGRWCEQGEGLAIEGGALCIARCMPWSDMQLQPGLDWGCDWEEG